MSMHVKKYQELKMKKINKLYSLLMIAIIISFAGFVLENIFVSFTLGFIDNKNMFFPFLFAYGLGVVAMYLLFGTPKTPKLFTKEISFKKDWMGYLYIFLLSFFAVSICEISLGYFVKWTCNIIWWEYTTLPLHITPFASVPTSTAFGLIITLCLRFCFDPLLKFFSKHEHKSTFKIVTLIITALLLADMVHSAIYMYQNENIFYWWEIRFPRPLIDVVLDLFR